PLVRARYIVERDYTTRPGMPTAWRLTYEELPIVDLAAPLDQSRTGPAAADRPVGAPREKRVVLLAACTELSWQRFGLSDALENADAAQDEADPNPEPKAAVRPHPGRPSDQDKQPAWRELDAAFRGRTRAIRLTGTLEQQEFSCILIIGDSR
ncbi:MAG: hypothetical protein JNK58_04195, partial [Phycisphaerae bacterium]|nr:hypothetical protein [Phycisphaerae bacterium]